MSPTNPANPPVTQSPGKGVKWTVMVFMGADTLAANAPLGDAADADLAEMKYVGSGGSLNILVQVHGKAVAPQRSHIGVTPMTDVPINEREPGDGHALLNFVRWALGRARHDLTNPNHYSMLVLWGHAYDFAFGRSLTQAGVLDALDFAELKSVLERLQNEYGGAGVAKLDILGFDACDLATVEMVCQFQPFVQYLLGSEIGIPIPGWPYDRILDRLRHPKGRPMGPAEFGTYVVRRFCESYLASTPVSLTMLDLRQAAELSGYTDELAQTLARMIVDVDSRDLIAFLFERSQTDGGKPSVDVADLCLNLVRDSGDGDVIAAARKLGDFLFSARPPLVGQSLVGGGRPLIVEHGRNAGETARLNGLSIYAPHVAPFHDFDAVGDLYQKFVFVQQTSWGKFVHALARTS
jgi:Clostripain family